MTKTLAIVCSDLHLWQTAPRCRAEKDTWFDVMQDHLGEVAILSGSLMEGPCPVIVAGDIFDRWYPTPEMVNFAIDSFRLMKEVYAIPGQHDLPNHRIDEMYRSAYGTLAKSGAIVDLKKPTLIGGVDGFAVYPFPWGKKITPPVHNHDGLLKVAVVHAYAWQEGYSYPSAPENQEVSSHLEKLQGYDTVIFGDNHKGFDSVGSPFVFNCGGFMRRKSDEKDYRPRVGLLQSDGTVETHYLSAADGDKFVEDAIEFEPDVGDFAEYFAALSETDNSLIDFETTLRRAAKEEAVRSEVEDEVMLVIDECSK
jgi:hypothetical protein